MEILVNAAMLNLTERPFTQKSNYGQEISSCPIFGFNGNPTSTILTRLVNKLS